MILKVYLMLQLYRVKLTKVKLESYSKMLYLLLSDKLKGRKRIYKKKEGGKK
jgi:hypothetical protein